MFADARVQQLGRARLVLCDARELARRLHQIVATVHGLPSNNFSSAKGKTRYEWEWRQDAPGGHVRVSKGANDGIYYATERPNLYKDAVVLHCCGASACDLCITRALRENDYTCPLCKAEDQSPVVAAKLCEDVDGFAEVYPEHKFRIVELLQMAGHTVGMTGDGVNDAPALKKAQIGIAVEGATDAAVAAADIVLTEPGLSVIIDAIWLSRKIFQRMKNYLTYRVASSMMMAAGHGEGFDPTHPANFYRPERVFQAHAGMTVSGKAEGTYRFVVGPKVWLMTVDGAGKVAVSAPQAASDVDEGLAVTGTIKYDSEKTWVVS